MIEITRVKYDHPVFFKVKKPEYVIEKICEYYGIKRYHILSKSRMKHIYRARLIARKLIRDNFPQYSLTGVGEIFGVDHSCILKSIRKFESDLNTDNQLKKEFQEITKTIRI